MYIDESGNTGTDYNNSEQPFFVMAGIIVPDDKWFELDRGISELKSTLFPDNKNVEIHAAKMFNPRRSTPYLLFM